MLSSAQVASQRPTRVRHTVLWLTVAAYLITYLDRAVIANVAPDIRREFGFSMVTMGWIMGAFNWAYALFQIPGGWLGDRIGPRRALALIVAWWSLFTFATVLAWSAVSMAVMRFLFGMGEAGAFPIATRSLSRWMLPEERGFAQGLTHAGSRLGGAITPILSAMLVAAFGWRMPFVLFGAVGLVWAAFWYWYYRDLPGEHSAVNDAELQLIQKSMGGVRAKISRSVPWRAILSNSTLWTLSLMYACYGYCFWVYMAWFPTYLRDHRHFNLTEMGVYTTLPLLAAACGNFAGGWISDVWAKRTRNLRLARSGVAISGFLLAASAIVPATLTSDAMTCVWFTCLALFGLESTVGVAWAIPLDIGGEYAGSVSAVMNTCGNMGGIVSSVLPAYLVGAYGWDVPFFVAAGLCVVAAALFVRIDATRHIFAGERAAV